MIEFIKQRCIFQIGSDNSDLGWYGYFHMPLKWAGIVHIHLGQVYYFFAPEPEAKRVWKNIVKRFHTS